ncbi:hypothetical protein MFLAVUS_000061 [Mucor flavus]|uniref:Uncharacterized protein n=1 Tax=Mucor flavus TaxID=439312 RepID=A0ABP9YIN4_9FUNG
MGRLSNRKEALMKNLRNVDTIPVNNPLKLSRKGQAIFSSYTLSNVSVLCDGCGRAFIGMQGLNIRLGCGTRCIGVQNTNQLVAGPQEQPEIQQDQDDDIFYTSEDTEPFEWDDSDNVYHTPENEPNEQDELDNNDNDGGQQVEGGGSRNRTLTSPENNVVAIQRQNVNKTTTDDIRREIFKKQNFDVNYSSDLSEDFDWIRHSVYTMLRFQECVSLSSDRIGHDDYIEYGASEAGKLYQGEEGTKRLEEGSKKLPKYLKDMLDHLLLIKNDGSNMQTTGFIHSGLESFFMTADRPVKYTKRISKSREIHISNDILGFGSTVLPALYSAWIAKEIIKNVKDSLHEPAESSNIEDSSWLDSYWNEDRSNTIMPEISNSINVHEKKKYQKMN